MSTQLPNFDKGKILVIGDLFLDRYWYGDATRISPEAPVPIVNVNKIDERPGGAGNVAMNLAALGAQVTLMGLIGHDAAGEILLNKLKSAQIDTLIQFAPDYSTIIKIRVLSNHQQLIRLDFEKFLPQLHAVALEDRFIRILSNYNAVILSDYAKGTISNPQRLIQAANQHQIPIFVDPKGTDFAKYKGATFLTPNRNEFERVFGCCSTEALLEKKGLEALQELSLQLLLITRGAEGMSLIREHQEPIHVPAKAYEVRDVTGAGDTVIAVLSAAIAAGEKIEKALVLANTAASLVVTRLGTGTVSEHELRQAMHKRHSKLGILTEEEVLLARADARLHGEKVVMTNGCFDILHTGHMGYLEDAKALGHRLLVAVNDDESIRKLKGLGRPVQSLSERMAILAGLRAVDWVIPFTEDTPAELIKKISPDILVKGIDYQGQEIAGEEHVLAMGGEIHYVGPPKQWSSSELIGKIKNLQSV